MGNRMMKKIFAIAVFWCCFINAAIAQTISPAVNYTDIWWAGPTESGWGIQITQHNDEIVGTWYTYDEQGAPLFILLSGCDVQKFNGSVCRGNLYRFTGTPYNVPFVKADIGPSIGVATLTFTSANTATFAYQIGGASISKSISRFAFGSRAADFPRDSTDLYYQADASGWGYSLAQNGDSVFGVIYHYDVDRKPIFLTFNERINSSGVATGALLRTRSNGSNYLTQNWRTSDIPAPTTVGTATTTFTRGGGLTLDFTINGFNQKRTMSRLPFGSGLPVAATKEAQCVAPRSDPKYGDKPGSLEIEKSWVRSYIDETYLWYNEVPSVSATSFGTPQSYFDALKTPALTASGRAKDEFHFIEDTASYEASSQSGVEGGYGASWAFLTNTPPRNLVVAFVQAGSPAALAGLTRGTRILSVDGADLVNSNAVNTLNAGLFPAKPGETHTFTVQDLGGASRTVTMVSANIAIAPVQNVKTIPTASGNVGYIQFNTFNYPSEGQLINAFNQLRAEGATDLVMDMRYNGGGLIYISSQLAYMIAGPSRTNNKIYDKLTYSDKRVADNADSSNATPFYNIASGFTNTGTTRNASLPTLNLPRVYVLTSFGTASASEGVINGLEGIGVQVIRIGTTTRGKPYGFVPTENCGTTYFSIEFKGANNVGFGDYADGFAPTCTMSDDFSKQFGDPTEARLEAALSYRQTGVCLPQKSSKRLGQAALDSGAEPILVRPAWMENKILLPKNLQGQFR
jgi:carboxyl-terminal processing protease